MEESSACARMDRMSPFYPLNRSLGEEVERLFSKWSSSFADPFGRTIEDDVMTEFRMNGQDSEYCPDFGSLESQKFSSISSDGTGVSLTNSGPKLTVSTRSKKRSKKQAQECVFCKNNGEEPFYYKHHILKDAEGKVVCPVLRAYTCPLCGAKGDNAHTVKYCPINKDPDSIATMNILKVCRNAMGIKKKIQIL